MHWQGTVREPLAAVPEGQYEAMLMGIESTKGAHGPLVRMEFVLRGNDDVDGRTVSGVVGKRLSENSKLGRWVSAILGRSIEVGEEINTGDLLHRDCQVVIRHRTADRGQTFGNVAKVQTLPDTGKTNH